ncbi:MAG: histidinol-phosphatase [Acutalibacteraceae bacterium]|jgi:histidinol-phosphatase (PHP family)
MLTNLHSHTLFCDGADSPQDLVMAAIEKGFSSFGFSGHGYTDFDLSYCMKDTDGYINTVNSLKEKYKGKIQIYLGVEEEAFSPLNCRQQFDYIIGSCHYIKQAGKYYPVDLSYEALCECIAAFDGDPLKAAERYYAAFCDYLLAKKPDIIGHFDLLTKFDEKNDPLFSNNDEYFKIAEKYLSYALKTEAFFEVNTGAMSRGYKSTPYPDEKLLFILKKRGGKVVLSSDAHSADTIDFGFKEARKMLKNIGFSHVYALYDGVFVKDYL